MSGSPNGESADKEHIEEEQQAGSKEFHEWMATLPDDHPAKANNDPLEKFVHLMPPDAAAWVQEMTAAFKTTYEKKRRPPGKKAKPKEALSAVAEEMFASPPRPLAEILDGEVAHQKRYIAALSDGHHDVLALWVAHTHPLFVARINGIGGFDTTGLLHLTSAEIESGKSLVLEVIEPVVAVGMTVLDPSAASVYRGVEAGEIGTLMIDEADNLFADLASKRALLGILNGSYRRGARVPRSSEKGGVDWFDVFGPKALAGIGELPRALASRSFRFRMRKRRRDERVERFRRRRVLQEARPLGREFAAWATSEVVAKLADAEPHLPEVLSDREMDISEPLVAIADLAGGDWPRRARAGLAELFKAAHEVDTTESNGTKLLSDIHDAFKAFGSRIASVDLAAHLNTLNERPWGGWNDGSGLRARNLSGLLRRYEIKAKTVRLSAEKTASGYAREDFEDAFARYLVDSRVTSVTTAQPSQKPGVSSGHTASPCDPTKVAANPHGYADVTHVTRKSPEDGSGGISDVYTNGVPHAHCPTCGAEKKITNVAAGITYLVCGHMAAPEGVPR